MALAGGILPPLGTCSSLALCCDNAQSGLLPPSVALVETLFAPLDEEAPPQKGVSS